MAKKKEGGISIGGDVAIEAGRDANLAAGNIDTGQSLSFEADWRDSAMSALGDAAVGPAIRSNVERRLDDIEGELKKDEPNLGFIQSAIGEIERLVPLVSSVLRVALPFVK